MKENIEELRKYADEFAKVGDASIAIQNDKDGFIHKWGKVMQYYRYICEHTPALSEDFLEAVDILTSIYNSNPSLKEWVNRILQPDKYKEETDSFSPSDITGMIDSYVDEINKMQHWDPDNINDIEWKLNECKKELMAHKSAFSDGSYNSLLNDINGALGKISKFYEMIKSEEMQDLLR